MILFFLFLAALLGIGMHIFIDLYYIDLLRSFLPYRMLLHFLVGLITLLLLWYIKKYSKGKFLPASSKTQVRQASWFFVGLLHLVVGFFYLLNFVDVYGFSSSERGHGEQMIVTPDVSLLYGNIFVDNRDIDELETLFDSLDSDVLLLVEFSDAHFAGLQRYLEENYLYINRLKREQGYDGTLVASRFPFEELPRYIAGFLDLEPVIFTLEDETSLIVNIVHTASPVSEKYFGLRNNQLVQMAGHLDKQGQDYANTATVLVGDFNVTPWSLYYDRLEDSLGDEWTIASEDFGMLFSWYLPFLPFVQAHIDHVMTKNLSVRSLEDFPLPGSDHYAISFTLDMLDDEG